MTMEEEALVRLRQMKGGGKERNKTKRDLSHDEEKGRQREREKGKESNQAPGQIVLSLVVYVTEVMTTVS